MVAAFALTAALAVAAFVPTLQTGDTVPAIPLVDQSGNAFSFASLRGQAVVLSFIYTRCADATMCPLTSSKFARLQTLIGTAPVRLVEITLDPQFDTPRVLRAYGAAYGRRSHRWTLATGAAGSIADLATRLGVATQWTRPGTLVHTESVIVLDPAGRIAQTIDGNAWTTAEVLAAATQAAGAPPSLVQQAGLWLTNVAAFCGGGRGAVNALEGLALLVLLAGGIAAVLLRSIRTPR